MSQHDESRRLRHMLDHAAEALQMASHRSRTDLDSDRQFALALTRLLEVVGEAAARIAPETRSRIPAVPWQDIIGMRNRLIHGYDEVDHDILWDVIQHDLPGLISELRKNLP